MKKIPILYGLMAIMAVVSCTGEFDFSREEVTALKVEQRVVAFGNEASSKTLAVSSDTEWTVSKDAYADWLTLEQTSDGLSVSVIANPTIVERVCDLKITSGGRTAEVKVKQSGLIPTFSSSTDQIFVGYGADEVTLGFQANVEWEVNTHCDWITLVRTESGLTVSLPENATDMIRTAYLDFYNAGCRFARILVSQNSSAPQAPDYYSVDVSALDWSKSYVHYVNDESGRLISVVTKESLDGASTVVRMYAAPNGIANFAEGRTVEPSVMYVDKDGTGLYAEDPHVGFEKVETASVEPLVVISDVKSHGAVKVGGQIWMAEDYKTTKFVDGTSIPSYVNGDAFWAAGDAAVVVHKEHYMYSAYALGWDGKVFDDSNFAPQGWTVPDETQYQTLLKTTGENLNNLLDGAAYLFGATNNLKATPSSSKVKVAALNYTNTWTCVPTAKMDKIMMDGIKSDGTIVSSGQDPKNGFSVRLIKK